MHLPAKILADTEISGKHELTCSGLTRIGTIVKGNTHKYTIDIDSL